MIAMLAICASLALSSCSSDDDDDDDNGAKTTTWAKIVEQNDWLKDFPEMSGKLVYGGTTTMGDMTQVAIYAYGVDEAYVNEYFSKVSKTSGFTKLVGSMYAKELESGKTIQVQGQYSSVSAEGVNQQGGIFQFILADYGSMF